MNTTQAGVLVLERINWFDPKTGIFAAPPRAPAVPMGPEEVLRRFQGIEGVPWPGDPAGCGVLLVGGLAVGNQRPQLGDYLRALGPHPAVDVLWCEMGGPTNPSFKPAPPPGASFLGFDLAGTPLAESAWSAVLSDVIFGEYEELRRQSRYLNDSLLFPEARFAVGLFEARRRLSRFKARTLEPLAEDESLVTVAVSRLPWPPASQGLELTC
jgi:hypothetical protein